jgi:hypothetical protein
VKNLARLALFFSLFFTAIFLFSAGLRFLHIRIEEIRLLPFQPRLILPDGLSAARWALPVAVYVSLLCGLSYAARLNAGLLSRRRRSLPAPLAMLSLFILGMALSGGISLALERLETMVPAPAVSKPLGRPGLLLTQGDTSIVLLRGPDESRGPRVVAIPGQPLLYQEQPLGPNNTVLSLPPVPFRNENPWFLRSLAIDFSLTGRQLETRLGEGLLPFFVYAGALIFLLVSLGFIQKFSNWPLANVFLGALCCRGILALETFLNSPEIQALLAEFLGNRFPLPLSWTVPLIFLSFGMLINLYTFLVYLAKRRSDEEEI